MGKVLGFKSFDDTEVPNIHENIVPAEVRRGEGISCKLKKGDGEFQEFKVWKISPLGIELDVKEEVFNRGETVSLEIRIFNETSNYTGLIVDFTQELAMTNIIGIRWFNLSTKRKEKNHGEICERRQERWSCNDQFLPTVVCSNPVKFNDFLFFKIKNISPSGFLLTTSLRNKYLIPGMALDSKVSLPLVGDFNVSFKIVHSRSFNNKLYLGCTLLKANQSFKEAMGNYIFQFNNGLTLSDLQKAGIKVSKASQAIDYSFVKTIEEYREVLTLRKMAYSQIGKMSTDIKEEDCSDIYDSRSRIFVAKYKGQVIGSFRIIFHQLEDELEHERFLSYPQSFPRKDEVVEVTRVCTHPDYRGSDILYFLMQNMVLHTILSGRRYIIGSAAGSLVSYYAKIGFESADIKFPHKDLSNQEHDLLLMDCVEALTGKSVKSLLWNSLYKNLYLYLEEKGIYSFTQADTIRINLMKVLYPISKFFDRSKKPPRKSEKQG